MQSKVHIRWTLDFNLSVILRPKLGRKERGRGENQDDNQYVLHTKLLQFHLFWVLNPLAPIFVAVSPRVPVVRFLIG